MMKPDYKKFETPEKPKHKVCDKPSSKSKTYLADTMEKSKQYDLLVNQLKGEIMYLESQLNYYKLKKGKFNIGFSNGFIAGRIAEIEDNIAYIKRILPKE